MTRDVPFSQKPILEKINLKDDTNKQSNKIDEFTNQLIDKVTKNLEKLNYNDIVANFYETYNFMNKEIDQPLNSKDLLINYKKILFLMVPLIPHFAFECLENLEETGNKDWPTVDKNFLTSNNINIVIQIPHNATTCYRH